MFGCIFTKPLPRNDHTFCGLRDSGWVGAGRRLLQARELVNTGHFYIPGIVALILKDRAVVPESCQVMQRSMQRIESGVSAVVGEAAPTHGFADNNAGFHLVATMLRLRRRTPVHGIIGTTIRLGDFIGLDAPPCVSRLAEFMIEEIDKLTRVKIWVNRAHLPRADRKSTRLNS